MRVVFPCLLLLACMVQYGWTLTFMRQQTCSETAQGVVIEPDAQAFIGGFFRMHNHGTDGYGCGEIFPNGIDNELQAFEAIRMAIEYINKKNETVNGEFLQDTYIPGVKLGMVVHDYCDMSASALDYAEQLYPQFASSASECTKDPNKLMLGLIGGSTSSVTIQLEKFAEAHQLPLISFKATAPELSDTEKYPNFLRTVPSDIPLMQVIVQFLGELKWDYVTVVYTDDTYGQGAYQEIRPLLDMAGICLTAAIATPTDDTTDATLDDTLGKVVETETVGVIYLGSSQVAKGLLRRGETVIGAGKLQWIFTDSISLMDRFPNQKYPRGVVSILSGSRRVTEFEDHWVRIDPNNPSSENPWYKTMYMESNQCKLAGITTQPYAGYPVCPTLTEADRRDAFVQDQFVVPGIHAVYTYAYALKKAHTDLCGGAPGLCTNLKTLSAEDFYRTYLRQVDFTYGKAERVASLASVKYTPYNAAATVSYTGNDIVNPSFDVFNFNDYPPGVFYKFTQIGSYVNGLPELVNSRLRMYSDDRDQILPRIPESVCPTDPCYPCLRSSVDPKYLYIHGDVIVTGLFDIHEMGYGALDCGEIRTDAYTGMQYLEAMVYALDQINGSLKSQQSILNGVQLGMLGFDTCNSPIRARHMITQVAHHFPIHDESGNMFDPNSAEVYMTRDSMTSLSLSKVMNDLMSPYIGYTTITPQLDDINMYPYFIRGVYTWEVWCKAYGLIAKRLGFHYLQAVYAEGLLGEESLHTCRRVLGEMGICIVASYEIEMDNGAEVVDKLRSRPNVQPVIVIGLIQHNRALFQGIRERNATGEFQVIVMGGANSENTGYEDVADGMIAIAPYPPDLSDFKRHIRSLKVQTYTNNPWFKDWYQALYNCAVDANDMGDYSQVCADITKSVDDSPGFDVNDYVITIIYNMFTIARGLDRTLQDYCGLGYNGICGNFMNAADKGARLHQNILQSAYSDSKSIGIFRYYDRDGNIPFRYLNYHKVDGYREVGSFKPAEDQFYLDYGHLRLYNNTSPQHYNSVCEGVCLDCLYMFRYQKYMHIPGDLLIPAVFDVHYAGDSPFMCGDVRTINGFQYTELFRWTLDRINSGSASVRLNNVKLGGLGFDGCTDPIRASTIVAGIHSGAFPRATMDMSDTGFELDDLQSWMSYESDSTVNIAEILQQFGVPVVTPGATSPLLDDKSKFTTFFRTIPSDGMVAEAMARLAAAIGFKYVITLNAPDGGSRTTLEEFRKYAEQSDICIGASYEFETDGSMEQIMSYIIDSTTKVVVVFAEPDRHIKELIEAKAANQSNTSQVIFLANRPWTVPAKGQEGFLINSINFMQSTMYEIQDFLRFLRDQNDPTQLSDHPNPWFKEWFQAWYECNLGGEFRYSSTCTPGATAKQSLVGDIWTLPTVNAIYSIAEAIHRTLMEKCGNSYSGICSSYISSGDTYERIMHHLDNQSFSDINNELFRFIEREANRGLTFRRWVNGGNTAPEGSFSDGNLVITEADTLAAHYLNTPSSCVGQCAQCERRQAGSEDFVYVSGNIMIAGLFDVHKAGATPYTCGEINDKYGFQLVEAFLWAIDYVNEGKGIFDGKLKRRRVRLGAVALDTCKSPTRAGNLVANIHSRNIVLQTTGGYNVVPDTFDVYIGPLDSESSVRVADVLTELGIPQISYGATSLELQDYQKYPFFLRSVPADDKQARALISFLKRFELRNIQVISQFSSVGEEGKKIFSELAYLNEICITYNKTVGQDGDIPRDEADKAVSQLLNNPSATVVVLIMDNPFIILRAAERNDLVRQNYFFIGTDKWGFEYENLAGLDRLIANRRALTLDIETADFPELDDYLESKTPNNYFTNPWFRDYFQYAYNCSLDTPTPEYPEVCAQDLAGYSRAPNYIQDPYVLYVVNAVFSTALGIYDTLVQECGVVNGLCPKFRLAGERRQKFLANIKKAQFIDQTDQPFYYTGTGESDRGYHMYEPLLEPNTNTYYWEDVGSYNDTHYLKLDATYDPRWSSDCTADNCVCDFPEYQPTRYMLKESPEDLNIVYISDIHAKDPTNPYGCGAIDTGGNFQNLLAFFYAIDLVNQNADNIFVGDLKLGGLALDTCSAPMRIGPDVYSLLSGEPVCGSGNLGQAVPPSSIVSFLAKNSQNAVMTSGILSPLKVTTMSQSATSVELNDKIVHSYFLRTVPPDNIQAIVMARILQVMGWDYASAVFTNNNYGRAAMQTLLAEAEKSDPVTCIGLNYSLPVDATLEDAKNAIDELNQKIGARVVVLFVSAAHARLLLQATQEKGLNHRFIWLGSDTWANDEMVTNDYEDSAAGSLTVQIASKRLQGFLNYVKSLRLDNTHGIPTDWFQEIYQTLHRCRILDSIVRKPFTQICTGEERITDEMISQDPYVYHTIVSVFMMAQGLSSIPECRASTITVSACLSELEDKKQTIYESIVESQFSVFPKELGDDFSFKFTDDGYGDIGYNILNFRRNMSTGRYEYAQIGTYRTELSLDTRFYQGYTTESTLPISRCPIGSSCNCLQKDYTTKTYSRIEAGTLFYKTEDGDYIDPNTGAVVSIEKIPELADRFRDIWAIVVATLAGVGVFVSICLFIYLLVMYPVRSGTSILGYMLSFGIILLYGLVFAFIVHADEDVCGLRRFCLGMVYVICYAAIFVKLVDCWRGRDKEDIYAIKYKKIGNPCGLFFVALLLVAVQVMINVEWLILEKPGMERVIYNNMLWPRCMPDDFYDEGLILSNVYVMFLIFLCIIAGLCAFMNEKNHHEARWLLGCVVLTVPCWCVWCLVAALGEYKMRDAAVAIGLLFNATVMLMCGPLRKLYLLNQFQTALEEEERKSVIENSGRPADYNSMYGRQYDNMPQLQEGSVRDSYRDDVFYDNKS